MIINKPNLNEQKKIPSACLALLSLCLGTVAPVAMAVCEAPSFAISIPDGKSASIEEMNRAQAAVSAFVSAGEGYIECVDTEQGRKQAEQARNAILDEMEKIAGTFNRQLRVFKKAQS